MFISPSEKDAIRTSINLLQERIAELETTIKSLTTAPAKPAEPAKQKRNWSPEQRAAASARMRARHEAKRA
jgi:Arc/MetJ-type ribon-helix-helix transcriptional regulator